MKTLNITDIVFQYFVVYPYNYPELLHILLSSRLSA